MIHTRPRTKLQTGTGITQYHRPDVCPFDYYERDCWSNARIGYLHTTSILRQLGEVGRYCRLSDTDLCRTGRDLDTNVVT